LEVEEIGEFAIQLFGAIVQDLSVPLVADAAPFLLHVSEDGPLDDPRSVRPGACDFVDGSKSVLGEGDRCLLSHPINVLQIAVLVHFIVGASLL
jgi:hypothetical protein